MSGARLNAFIITVRIDQSASETFYILARDVEQAQARAIGLAQRASLQQLIAA
jgi:hypothetical protein